MATVTFESAYAPLEDELRALIPPGARVIDAHTHLGLDEDGQSLDLGGLIAYLDHVGDGTQACVFPLHDPERHPAYRIPNDRVLEWAQNADGRLFPYCRLDPSDGPVAEAERCLARGARGIKLHPRAQSFGFGNRAAEAIFEVARDASVPILIHAGRGMPAMDALADLALKYPEVGLVLAHGAIADQGLFATRLEGHPRAVYDTSIFSGMDLVELFARIPAERIVFGSDPPYGRPIGGLFLALRAAAFAELDSAGRALIAGETMRALLEGRPLAPATPPRVPQIRPASGRLLRVSAYLMMAFGAAIGAGPPPDRTRALPAIAMARAACRDPAPGIAGPALARIDALLSAAEQLIAQGEETATAAFGLVMSAGAIAATEPLAVAEAATG
jgi:uncharacterized protein